MWSDSMRGLHRAQVGERRVHRHVDGVVVGLRQLVVQLLDGLERLEVIEVHLPVATDERLAAGDVLNGHWHSLVERRVRRFPTRRDPAGRRARAARVTLPHRSTRGRPRSASPNCASAAALSPPPDDREAVRVGDRMRDRARAGHEPLVLEHTHRSVPEDHVRVGDDVGELGGAAGPDVVALPPVGNASAVRRDLTGRRQGDDVGRQVDRLAALEQLAAGIDLIGLEQRVTDRCALRGEEREAHRAADDERVDDPEQRVDHSELVAHLRTAEHRDERASRMVAHAEQHLDLAGEQAAGGARQRPRRPDDRRVGAMRGAERVVDVRVLAVDELRDESGVVLPPRRDRTAGSRAARRRAPAPPVAARTGAIE